MYTLEDVYKTFPSGCTEEYKILRAFEMGKQTSDKEIESLSKHIIDLQKDKGNLTDKVRELEQQIETQSSYAKLYYQEVMALQSQLKASKDKYEELKKSSTKAKKILKTIADNWKGSGLNIEKYRKILKAYNDAEMFFKEIKEND